MKKPILVVMAAGMGSRYGKLKQLDPVGPNGEVIIDYSIYDAKRAGFETVVFIIKKAIEAEFKKVIGDRISKYMDVRYAFQELDKLPEGYSIPEGRQKPYGTAHAILCAKDVIDAPFAIINADDYYGSHAFKTIFDYLSNCKSPYDFCAVSYLVKNTVTKNGSVSRGVCTTDENGYLKDVTERVRIEYHNEGIGFTEDDGATWTMLDPDTPVSMNLWGVTPSFIDEIEQGFPEFLDKGFESNPVKCEYYLPSVISSMIESKKASVKLLSSTDKWYGVTYKEDKQTVVDALVNKVSEGQYPEKLWER